MLECPNCGHTLGSKDNEAVAITGQLIPAQLAMAFDCEGSITLSEGTAGSKIFVVTISNASRDLLEYLRSSAGMIGKINGPYIPANADNKLYFTWTIPTRKIIDFLKLILPYLIVKRRQAIFMIEIRSAYEHGIVSDFKLACDIIHKLNQEGNAGPGAGRPRKQETAPAPDDDI